MNLRVALPALCLPLLATALPALAQEAAPRRPAPLFPTMGPDGSGTQLGAQLGHTDGDDVELFDQVLSTSSTRFDLMAQYVAPTGVGGYATIGGSSTDAGTHLGSLEAGALYRVRDTNVTFRAGLVLPTSSDNDGDFSGSFESLMHGLSTSWTRPSDGLTAAPDTTTLRVAAMSSWREGDLVARADVGLDVVVDTDGERPDAPFLHVDVGAGYHNGKGGVVAELSNLVYLEETDNSAHLIALTGELTLGSSTGYVTISRPFGDDLSDRAGVTNILIGLRAGL